MAQNDQVQALIQEIDEVLSKTSPRLPWVMSNDAMRQRQVLEQARTCLSTLQVPGSADETTSSSAGSSAGLLPSGQPAAESAQQVLQSVLQEMTYLRVNMLQPMRSDVELLRQQREALAQEIRQLEAQRQQYALPQQPNPQLLMEFLQSAMGQMQENLRGQVTQMVATLSDQAEPPLLEGVLEPPIAPSALSPVQRLEQIQRVQTQSDQLLLKLDSTLQVIFESLQNNIQSYQESLEQGLSRIHNLGQQGEAMFAALVTRLAEQLGREASAYLQSSMPQSGDRAASTGGNRSALTAKPDSAEADLEIARLLEELNALDQSAKPAEGVPDTRWQPQPFTLDATPGSLEAFDQELQQLDLSAVPLNLASADDDEMTLFQEDQEFVFPESEVQTQIQIDEEELSLPPDPGNEDLESALDLLNQLSAEVEIEPAEAAQPLLPLQVDSDPNLDTLGMNSLDLDEPPTVVQAIAPAEAGLVSSPDALYEDEFYQSLFGDAPDAATDDLVQPVSAEPPPANPPSQPPELDFPAVPDQSEHSAERGLSDAGLFDGLEDPAAAFQPIQDAEPDFLLDFADNALPQSVETLLLTDPEPALPEIAPSAPAASETLALEEDLFWELIDDPQLTPPAVESQPEAMDRQLPAAIETIAALTDLIPADATPDSLPVAPTANGWTQTAEDLTLETDFLLELREGQLNADAFEPAQPGEDLLVPNASTELAIVDFEVGEDTLQQLTADLSSLESGSERSSRPQPDAVDALEDWMLDNWGNDLPQSVPELQLDDLLAEVPADLEDLANPVADQIASSITLEDLLFTDAGDLITQAAVQPADGEGLSAADADSKRADLANETEANPLSETSTGSNAFTLEGLESLFEGLPEIGIDVSPETPALEETLLEMPDRDRPDLAIADGSGATAPDQSSSKGAPSSPAADTSSRSTSELKKKN
ncbi:MAG TPA: hypothetical protein V6C57_18845 [Coleofasciculaceae cyanobacterium]